MVHGREHDVRLWVTRNPHSFLDRKLGRDVCQLISSEAGHQYIKQMGRAMGLEPTTPGITIRCSNQLSYARHVMLTVVSLDPRRIGVNK